MIKREFYNPNELDEVTYELATASKYPLYMDTNPHPGEDMPLTAESLELLRNRHAIINDRDDRVSYIGTDKYDLIQHHEVIDAIRDAVELTTGDIEFGVVRDYGEQINGVLVFGNRGDARIDLQELLGDAYIPPEGRPDTDPTAETSGIRDAVGLGMRFENSFDGNRTVGGSTMGYRYICQNWLVWDEREIGSKQRQHVRTVDEEDGLSPDFFVDLITDVFDVRDEIADVIEYAEMRDVPVTWAPAILEDLGFGPRYQRRITGQLVNFSNGEVREDVTTLWRLYNAITRELDHRTVNDTKMATHMKWHRAAWNALTVDPREPEEEPDEEELEEFVIQP